METSEKSDLYAEKLSLTESEFEEISDSFSQRNYDGKNYYYYPDYTAKIERGTVLIDGEVVRGFPKIPRTLVLEEGVPRYFDDTVVVEEKMNGYNTRVVRLEDLGVVAFTRGGIICPFTTHKVKNWLDLGSFFDDHPDKMLCGEMTGKENPYTAHDYSGIESLEFLAFDIRDRGSGDSVEVDERRNLCESYGFPQVPFKGKFDADETDGIKEVIESLNAQGREGVVMKTEDVSNQLKYTTSAANQGDLSYAFSLPFDYGQDFMFRRIVREAFQAVEWEEEVSERADSLGEAILGSMVDAIHEVEEGENIGERHTVRGESEVIEELLEHLRDLGVQLVIERDEKDGSDGDGDGDDDRDDERVVTFVKKMQSTKDKTESYLEGQIVRG
ncbi:MAG: RNA ligase [Halobacteria archaeon]|nr:RNA ligase [Halobacteria archaeon]